MAETMIERVKSALYLAHPWGGDDQTLKDQSAEWQAVYEAMAIAAIGAMRKPTEEMVVEGEAFADHPDWTWEAMIDAALSEGGE